MKLTKKQKRGKKRQIQLLERMKNLKIRFTGKLMKRLKNIDKINMMQKKKPRRWRLNMKLHKLLKEKRSKKLLMQEKLKSQLMLKLHK